MTLHLMAVPHTITHQRFSSCAFTGKVLRFSPMLRSVGYEVVHYGVEGAASGATEQVNVLGYDEWQQLGGKEPGTGQIGAEIRTDSRLYQEFNRRIIPLLRERFQERDVICLPFGHAHGQAMEQFRAPPGCFNPPKVEVGIGYPAVFPRASDFFRIYESQAWSHFHLGKEAARQGQESGTGSDFEWVIPNYYDPNDWPLGTGAGQYLLYFGRLNQDKGLDVVVEIARARPDLVVKLCGQGDPTPWLTLPNIRYCPPLHGEGRADLLGMALAVLLPTRYVEPFGGVAVEAMLCGTPVLSSAFGAFTETVLQGDTGYRCRTLGDWLQGIEAIEHEYLLPRPMIRRSAQDRFDMYHLAHAYDAVFRQLDDLYGDGWFTRRPAPREDRCA